MSKPVLAFNEAYSNPKDEEKVLKVAKNELREDPKNKNAILEQFVEWIKQNNDLENCRTDENFLLRFLRAKKYSVPMAQQMLLKYLNLRQKYQQVFFNLDYLSPKINELMTNGYIFPSPVRDQKGRLVILTIIKNFDPFKYTSYDMAKAHVLTYETLLDDEHNQIMGFSHIGDVAASTASHVTLWSPTDFATLVKWGEQSYPMRHKEVHIFNMATTFKYILDFAKGRVSEKMKDRVYIYKNMDELKKTIDLRVLPKEYGGEIPLQKMLDIWKETLDKKRDTLIALDKIKLLSDQGIISRKNKNYNNNCVGGDVISLPGAFRRLEVD